MNQELVTLKTRVPRPVAEELALVARDNDRSLAAELRQAIDRHLTAARTELATGEEK